jgi:hypothetical protein
VCSVFGSKKEGSEKVGVGFERKGKKKREVI